MLLEKKFIYLNFSSYFLGMLRLKNVVKTFGALRAVDNVSLEVNEKEIVGLIGPNGSGKTTLFNLIMGALHPESGKIIFQGRDITNLPPFKICHLGINRVHQIPRPFLKMTVIDNVITAYLYGRRGNKYEARSKALEALEFVGLKEKALLSASALNLYERKLLEISRSLVTGCKLLLLDEIIAGLNPAEMERAENMIRKIRDELGITIFWIEHVMKAIKKVAERVIVMNQGKKIAEGKFEEIASNEEVIKAYLGEKP
ncbi:MAG: ABC transporter ATP-binding protein [Ignisphaera sp.]